MTPAIERLAARAADEAVVRLATAVRDAVPQAEVAIDGERVTISGRGVRKMLRWPVGLLR